MGQQDKNFSEMPETIGLFSFHGSMISPSGSVLAQFSSLEVRKISRLLILSGSGACLERRFRAGVRLATQVIEYPHRIGRCRCDDLSAECGGKGSGESYSFLHVVGRLD